MVFAIGATLIGAGVGLYGANKASKSQDAATAASLAGFKQYEPYVDANLSGSQAALGGVLETGAYGGQTLAGPNDFQTGTATNMGNIGGNLQNSGYAMMNTNAGFGTNANQLYNQFQGLSQNAQRDRLSSANQYAMDNMDPIVAAAMRDDRRNLQENTLTGIDLAASGTNNMNSSRAGVAEAVANRGYDDRRADVRSQVMDSLRTQSLNQQNQQFVDQSNALTNAGNANTAISNAYNSGMNTLGEGANFGMNAGNALQGYDQSALNDQQAAFERQRDFELQQRQGFQSGILGKAPSAPTVTPNLYNGVQGAISGGMQGFGFANQYAQQNGLPSNNASSSFFNPFFGGQSGLGIS
jgi:hypothetical protein